MDYQKYINALRKCAKEHESDIAFTGHIIVSDLCRDTANLLEALEQKPRWIPVSERLPEKNTAVLTYVSTGPSKTYCLAYWNDVREGWEEWIGYKLIEKDRGYKVLAWMPLPESYKGAEK